MELLKGQPVVLAGRDPVTDRALPLEEEAEEEQGLWHGCEELPAGFSGRAPAAVGSLEAGGVEEQQLY